MIKNRVNSIFLFILLSSFFNEIYAQENNNFIDTAQSVQQKLQDSVTQLNELREQIVAEKVPLGKKLGDLESELVKIRLEYQQASRLLDSRTLDLSNLRSEIKSRKDESAYISNLLGEYARNFESRLHIAEIQRYNKPLEKAKLAIENSNLSEYETHKLQTELLSAAIERLDDAIGGARFDGTAVDASGLVKQGTFVLIGPSAVFMSKDGSVIGTAEQRLGSLEPAIIAYGNPSDAQAVANVINLSTGYFPFDPTLGNAHKIEETKETIWEHVKRGGPVMWPIGVLAGIALLVAFYKWITLLLVRNPSPNQIKALLKAVSLRDRKAAEQAAKKIRGYAGKMLVSGVEHIEEPQELVEEVMYETVLATRLKLQSMLPFIALTSSSAPLLGLLGTVTGIMNTFTLMTVFGTGDVKTLSSGISEALITTECGLYVAIPSLLMYAFLSRKAKNVIDQMEKAAVAYVNQLGKTPFLKSDNSKDDAAKFEMRTTNSNGGDNE